MDNYKSTPVLFPVEPEEFWRQMKKLVEDVLTERGVVSKVINAHAESPKLLKAKDVCELFQISKPTIYEWMRKGQLQSVKIESRRFFGKRYRSAD
jgi:predicted DNA-binding transcriptional regulator AlpA